jgi:hypothetical protein
MHNIPQFPGNKQDSVQFDVESRENANSLGRNGSEKACPGGIFAD